MYACSLLIFIFVAFNAHASTTKKGITPLVEETAFFNLRKQAVRLIDDLNIFPSDLSKLIGAYLSYGQFSFCTSFKINNKQSLNNNILRNYITAIQSTDQYLICGDQSGKIRFFDINTVTPNRGILDPLFSLEGHTRRITCLAIMSTNNVLASGSIDKNVRIWDIQSKKCIREIFTLSVVMELVSYNNSILVANAQNSKCFWNIHSADSSGTRITGNALSITPDNCLLSGGKGGYITEYAINNAQKTIEKSPKISSSHSKKCIHQIACSQHGKIALRCPAFDEQIGVEVWDNSLSKLLWELSNSITHMTWIDDEKLVVIYRDGYLRVYKAEDGGCLQEMQIKSLSNDYTVAFALLKNGCLAITNSGGEVVLYEPC